MNVPDSRVGTKEFAQKELGQLLNCNDYRAVILSDVPHNLNVFGPILKEKLD
jgi:hypothetical protein